jgi:glycosyltransferase involved in cell wall biosynthesis
MSRVAFLLGNLTDGGSETKTVRLANRLARSGTDAHVLYLDAPHTLLPVIDDRVAVECLRRRGKFSFGALRRLRAYLEEHDIETVICVNQYPLVYGWPACRFGRRRRRFVGAMNAYELTSLRDRLFMLLYGFILRRCDQVILGSRAQERLWTKKYRLDAGRCRVIYNGVDVEYFAQPKAPVHELRESIGIDDEATVIGCVAHLRPEKSHGDLLAAMRDLAAGSAAPVVLLLIGDGPEEPRLRDYVTANGLGEYVHFCGRAADVRPYLSLMDIFVLPSSSEVFPNAVLEAMSMGVPVVCTAVGGSVEIVIDGETGLTYPRHEVDDLVRALQGLIADGARRRRFGEKGAARARDVFSIERMDEQYAEIIVDAAAAADRC